MDGSNSRGLLASWYWVDCLVGVRRRLTKYIRFKLIKWKRLFLPYGFYDNIVYFYTLQHNQNEKGFRLFP